MLNEVVWLGGLSEHLLYICPHVLTSYIKVKSSGAFSVCLLYIDLPEIVSGHLCLLNLENNPAA